ncbi:gluconeogenesis factor YvcK family protein [Rhizobium sp. R693]|uniref:gluconeogenesis factor YvcK family protein n=1 Tax=Rhizobium sp. R693 TaxID=1764276 RepID=UPI000B537162|nr:gluconeogenesis factor YvcK family protein [Rhizobium sp. R693]OWV86848.1 hypothetical protein ATY79_08535 [Rhizobium sp. R693]
MKRIVLFSGGSACRAINIALCGKAQITRIVPAWDSGGSSKIIREELGLLAVGDLRQALMTMAHGEGRAGDVVKICNARISGNHSVADARTEFLFYSEGRHPLLERMEPGLRGAILNYLKTFIAAAGQGFDFRNGSIGNFILTGACLAHNGDVNTAIFVFRKLCGIDGDVWPSSLNNDQHLNAILRDGRTIERQHAITKLPEKDGLIGIDHIQLHGNSGNPPEANPNVNEAIAKADLIVFGPGSFYTSILPHLQIEGLVEALSRVECPRVWIGNILQCRETVGMSLGDVVVATSKQWSGACHSGSSLITHLLANRVLFPFEKTVGVFPYLAYDFRKVRRQYEVTVGEFEDAWNRGQHDGEAVATMLLRIVNGLSAA